MTDSHPIALVVDDEPDICELMSLTLGRMDVRTDIAMSLAEANRRLEEKHYDFCLTDLRLPDGDGLQLVEKIHAFPVDRAMPVAVFTAHGNMDSAIAALQRGAFDFVTKPVNLERLRALVQLALKLREERYAPTGEYPTALMGDAEASKRLREQIGKVARSDAPVHIHGEIGAGKAITARAIHDQSPRADKPFIALNCAEAPAEQLEQLLLGSGTSTDHDTGRQVDPLFIQAQGGTLFLEDVTCLPAELQVKLTRVIQDKCLSFANGSAQVPLDVRILSASDRLLTGEVVTGQLRRELYYRLNVIELTVPPLRERSDDIPLLARNLMRDIATAQRGPTPRLTREALDVLQAYDFPGNLRQLENILQRAFTLSENQFVRAEDLQLESGLDPELRHRREHGGTAPAITGSGGGYPAQFTGSEFASLDEFLEFIERGAIDDALRATDWNRTAAAEKLGISFRSLRYRLKKLGLENA